MTDSVVFCFVDSVIFRLVFLCALLSFLYTSCMQGALSNEPDDQHTKETIQDQINACKAEIQRIHTVVEERRRSNSHAKLLKKVLPTTHKQLRQEFLDGKNSVFELLAGDPANMQRQDGFAIQSPINYTRIALAAKCPYNWVTGDPPRSIFTEENTRNCTDVFSYLQHKANEDGDLPDGYQMNTTKKVFDEMVGMLEELWVNEEADDDNGNMRIRIVDKFMVQSKRLIDEYDPAICSAGQKLLYKMRKFLLIGRMTANHQGYETRKKIRRLRMGGLFLVFLIIMWADDVDPLGTLTGIKQLKLVYELCGAFPGNENDARYQVYTLLFLSISKL